MLYCEKIIGNPQNSIGNYLGPYKKLAGLFLHRRRTAKLPDASVHEEAPQDNRFEPSASS